MSEIEREGVFTALGDPHRRVLLDRLRIRNGQTLTELCEGLPITRQAVSKHLRVMADADLVLVRREGRATLHYLNPVPLNAVAMRWLKLFDKVRLDTLFERPRRAGQ